MHGKWRVLARRGWAGEKSDFFSILLDSSFLVCAGEVLEQDSGDTVVAHENVKESNLWHNREQPHRVAGRDCLEGKRCEGWAGSSGQSGLNKQTRQPRLSLGFTHCERWRRRTISPSPAEPMLLGGSEQETV